MDYESLDYQLSELKAETLLDLIEAMKTSTIKSVKEKRKRWGNERVGIGGNERVGSEENGGFRAGEIGRYESGEIRRYESGESREKAFQKSGVFPVPRHQMQMQPAEP